MIGGDFGGDFKDIEQPAYLTSENSARRIARSFGAIT
jgi:hypothetical protein